MRRWIVALCLLVWAAGARASELYTYEDAARSNMRFECEDFSDVLPAELAELSVFRAGDEILCGAICSAYWKESDELHEQSALVAVRRLGRVLLIGAYRKDGAWSACVETDNFFSSDRRFDITVAQDVRNGDEPAGGTLALVVGDERFRVMVDEGGAVHLKSYQVETGDGRVFRMAVSVGVLYATLTQDGQLAWIEEASGWIGDRLCAWTYESLPTGTTQMQAFARLHPVALGEDQAFITGVNFRERPTGESRSMGMYTARVCLLGETSEGVREPWYHVAVGDTEGWVSGVYLVSMRKEKSRLLRNIAQVLPVARTKAETALLQEPGGSGKSTLSQGTMMHVLAESDGWLHVLIPRGEISWKTDWDGEYGFVQAESVHMGLSIADVRWQ